MAQEGGLLNARPQSRYNTDLEALKKEVQLEIYGGRGPGGERKDKTETAVRLTHIPTGIVITASKGRTQAENRELALERLQKRLERLNRGERERLHTDPPPVAFKEKERAKRQGSEKKKFRRPPEEAES